MNKVIAEEDADDRNITLDAHKVTADTFSQTSNTQKDNANAILKNEKLLDKLDALAEASNFFTINDAGYYESDSENAKNSKGDPVSNLKTVINTSDGKKGKAMDTSNIYLQPKLLSNRTLPIITTTMNPQIDDWIATCSGTPHTTVTPLTKEVITDAACSSARVIRSPRHVIRTSRDGTTPGDTLHAVSPPPGYIQSSDSRYWCVPSQGAQ